MQKTQVSPVLPNAETSHIRKVKKLTTIRIHQSHVNVLKRPIEEYRKMKKKKKICIDPHQKNAETWKRPRRLIIERLFLFRRKFYIGWTRKTDQISRSCIVLPFFISSAFYHHKIYFYIRGGEGGNWGGAFFYYYYSWGRPHRSSNRPAPHPTLTGRYEFW